MWGFPPPRGGGVGYTKSNTTQCGSFPFGGLGGGTSRITQHSVGLSPRRGGMGRVGEHQE